MIFALIKQERATTAPTPTNNSYIDMVANKNPNTKNERGMCRCDQTAADSFQISASIISSASCGTI